MIVTVEKAAVSLSERISYAKQMSNPLWYLLLLFFQIIIVQLAKTGCVAGYSVNLWLCTVIEQESKKRATLRSPSMYQRTEEFGTLMP